MASSLDIDNKYYPGNAIAICKVIICLFIVPGTLTHCNWEGRVLPPKTVMCIFFKMKICHQFYFVNSMLK